jgi:serine/threonine protein kinase/Tol biopolymer transport system component
MGVVYKARDTKLDRDVALKFLPPQLAASEADRARFVQEAKAAAALNHPNVCSIIDIQDHEASDGGGRQLFIVMEFVDGQTLRSRMSGSGAAPISIKQAVELGIQVADGLAVAHEKGIVHRDIKPENIMIRKDGIVQIMDFGLAKLRGTTTRLTKQGSTVGTAGYMSPEQIQGLDVDHRSDIFSLGVVLYELFTGQLPFRGVHETALAYEIVNVDAPPMLSIKADIDPGLDAIVLDCMEKDPRERCQSVAEVARDLRRIKRESSRQRASRFTASRPAYTGPTRTPGAGSASMSGMATPGGSGWINVQSSGEMGAFPTGELPRAAAAGSARTAWIIAALLLVTTIAAVAWRSLAAGGSGDRPTVQSLIIPPDKTQFKTNGGGHLAISPDGLTVAFVVTDSTGSNRIWVRPLNSLNATSLQGTEGATYPFWSSDSRTIAFFAGGKLKKIDSRGGPTLTICTAPDGRGGTWSKAGVIVFAPGSNNPLSRVSAAGGTPTVVTKLDTPGTEVSHRWPHFLPDGDHFLYVTMTAATATDSDVVNIGTLEAGTVRTLFRGSSNIAYASGRLLFERQSTLMAQPFDPDKMEFTADAVPVAENVQYNAARNNGIFSVSNNGVLVYQSGERREPEVAIYDRAGRRTALLGEAGGQYMKFSPDGKKIAYSRPDPQSGQNDIWIYDLARRIASRFTFDAASDIVPVWSPKGDSIVFSSNRGGRAALYLKSANGTGDENLLVKSEWDLYATSWSKDGRFLSVTAFSDPATHTDLWTVPMSGERKQVPFLKTAFNEWVGEYSRDGKWVAYQSDETGKYEIYVRSADNAGGKWQISGAGGTNPLWSADGRELLYSSLDRKLVSAHVDGSGPTMVVDSLSTLFDFESTGIVGSVGEMSPDGRSFLARVSDLKGAVFPITLVVNWDKELEKQ